MENELEKFITEYVKTGATARGKRRILGGENGKVGHNCRRKRENRPKIKVTRKKEDQEHRRQPMFLSH